MKILFVFLFCITVYDSFTAITHILPKSQNKIALVKQDTIEFTQPWSYTGRCNNYCFVYVGTNTVTKVNGRAIKIGNTSKAYTLFCPCPSKIKLIKGKSYKYLVDNFNYKKYKDCTNGADTMINNHSYVLVRPLK